MFIYLTTWGGEADAIEPVTVLALRKADLVPALKKLVVLKVMRVRFEDSKISKFTDTFRIYYFLLEMKNVELVQTFPEYH